MKDEDVLDIIDNTLSIFVEGTEHVNVGTRCTGTVKPRLS